MSRALCLFLLVVTTVAQADFGMRLKDNSYFSFHSEQGWVYRKPCTSHTLPLIWKNCFNVGDKFHAVRAEQFREHLWAIYDVPARYRREEGTVNLAQEMEGLSRRIFDPETLWETETSKPDAEKRLKVLGKLYATLVRVQTNVVDRLPGHATPELYDEEVEPVTVGTTFMATSKVWRDELTGTTYAIGIRETRWEARAESCLAPFQALGDLKQIHVLSPLLGPTVIGQSRLWLWSDDPVSNLSDYDREAGKLGGLVDVASYNAEAMQSKPAYLDHRPSFSTIPTVVRWPNGKGLGWDVARREKKYFSLCTKPRTSLE